MCAVATSFWTSANGGQGVLRVNTTGDSQLPDPIRIPGSSIGAVPTAYSTSAQAVYPTYDGVTTVGGTRQSLAINPKTGLVEYSRYPSTFWTNSSMTTLATNPADFTNWHSSFQAEYISRVSGSTTPPSYIVGTSSDPSAIYMLDDQNRPVNLLSLTLSDYGKLSEAEKERFNDKLTASGHLAELGLVTGDANADTFIGSQSPVPGTGLSRHLVTIAASSLTAAQEALFSEQIQMLIDEVQGSFAFNPEKINAAADDIMARFEIVSTFASAKSARTLTVTGTLEQERTAGLGYDFGSRTESTSTLTKTRVSSLDGGESIRNGVEMFLRAETEILNMKQRRAVIAENSAYRDPNMDVPNLIYQLQLLYEGEKKGIVDAGTEEFRQLHRLLEDYNVMQQMLTTTLAAFDTSDSDDKRRFMNIGAKDDGSVDEDQLLKTAALDEDDFNNNDYVESYNPSATGIDSTHNPRYHWSVLANYDDDLADMFRDYYDGVNDVDVDIDIDGDYSGKLNQTQMLAFSMFADEPWADTDDRGHPIETLYNAERPKFDLIDEGEGGAGSLQILSKNSFDQFQTALSNTITILNQQNQIKQNEIENATKEQNRHFELGNNALRKMNDLLLMIGRM